MFVVTSSVEARLSVGFFPQLAEVFPLAHCVGPQVPKFSVVLFFYYACILAPGCLISCTSCVAVVCLCAFV